VFGHIDKVHHGSGDPLKEVQRLRAEVERLKEVCKGRERVLAMPDGQTDFDDLCNRVVAREWLALDPELLVGYAQGCFDEITRLNAEVERLQGLITELVRAWGDPEADIPWGSLPEDFDETVRSYIWRDGAAELQAEVERLTAENERVRQDRDTFGDDNARLRSELAAAQARVRELEATPAASDRSTVPIPEDEPA
jgi:hypothetical protein